MLTEVISDENTDTAMSSPVESPSFAAELFRFLVKNGEYIYARVNDIVLIESCDHWVRIHLAYEDKIRRVIRNNTLKDFLAQVPGGIFKRIGRFCAVNVKRLSGGSYNDQSLEFDFKISIKLKHGISLTAYNTIGK